MPLYSDECCEIVLQSNYGLWRVLTLIAAMQWGQFEKMVRRADGADTDAEGRLPVWGTASNRDNKDRVANFGIKPRLVSKSPRNSVLHGVFESSVHDFCTNLDLYYRTSTSA